MGEVSYPSSEAVGWLPRADVRGSAAPFALSLLAVLALGSAHGGYFSTAWGWAIVALVGVAMWSLTVTAARRPGVLEGIYLGALLAFASWFAVSGIWGIASTALDEAV